MFDFFGWFVFVVMCVQLVQVCMYFFECVFDIFMLLFEYVDMVFEMGDCGFQDLWIVVVDKVQIQYFFDFVQCKVDVFVVQDKFDLCVIYGGIDVGCVLVYGCDYIFLFIKVQCMWGNVEFFGEFVNGEFSIRWDRFDYE